MLRMLQKVGNESAKRPRREWDWILKVIFVLSWCFLFGAELMRAQSPAGQLVLQAYAKPQILLAFSLENLRGKTVNIQDYRGRVLLNFFSSW
jgi:hypothetical protein